MPEIEPKARNRGEATISRNNRDGPKGRLTPIATKIATESRGNRIGQNFSEVITSIRIHVRVSTRDNTLAIMPTPNPNRIAPATSTQAAKRLANIFCKEKGLPETVKAEEIQYDNLEHLLTSYCIWLCSRKLIPWWKIATNREVEQ